MADNSFDKFDSYVSETIKEFHNLTLSNNNSSIIPDFDDSMDGNTKPATRKLFFINNRPLVAGVASIAIVLGLAIPALISWQGGSNTGVARKIKTTNDKQETSAPETKSTSSAVSSSTTEPVSKENNNSNQSESKNNSSTQTTAKSSTNTTAPPTTAAPTTAPITPTAPPTGFWAYENEKYPGYWKVKFSWTPSTTPGVSYCVSDSLSAVQNCTYNASLTATWQNLNRSVGDTALNTYYITAVTPAGVVSSVVSTTYAIPA